MTEQGLYRWLSGTVPGGLAVVPVAVLFLAYIWFEVKRHSGLVGPRAFRLGLGAIILFVLGNFTLARLILAPVPVPVRILVLPYVPQQPDAAWAGRAAAFSVERMLQGRGLKKQAIVPHRQVTSLSSFPAAVSDSAAAVLARTLGIRYLVSGTVAGIPGGCRFSVSLTDLKKDRTLHRLEQDVPEPALPAFNRAVAEAAIRHFRLRGIHKGGPVSITASPQAYRLHARARDTLAAGAFAAAETLFGQALQADSNFTEALLGLCEAAREQALPADSAERKQALLKTAAGYGIRAVRRNPDAGEGYLQLAWTHIYQEKWTEAENELKIALHHMPSDARVYYLLSKLHRNRYQNYGFSDEGDILERAILLSPAYVTAMLHLTDRYLNANRKNDALRLAGRVLEIDPGNVQAAVTLSLVHIYRNSWDDALRTCRGILARSPDEPDALYNLGIAFKGKAEYDSALVYLGRAADRGVLNAYNYMAVIHESRREYYSAIRMLRQRVRLGQRGEKWRDESRKSLYRLVHKAGIVVDSNFSYQELAESPAVDSALVLEGRSR